MAKKRFDVVVAEKNGDKTYWRNIGVVIQTDKGFSLKLSAIPVGWDGWAQLFEPKPQGGQQEAPSAAPASTAKQTSANKFADMIDDVPF